MLKELLHAAAAADQRHGIKAYSTWRQLHQSASRRPNEQEHNKHNQPGLSHCAMIARTPPTR